MYGMFLMALLCLVLLLGFGYIIWVLASKESGVVKTIGQIIAVVIVILAVIMFVYGGKKGYSMGRGYPGMMMMDKGHHEMMDKMMKSPEMKKLMKEHMKQMEKK